MKKYKEYIDVDPDFIPVFSSNSDRIYPNKWKSFYPHDDFKMIISSTLDSLEMSTAEKNKPIWISGDYGTGKTYASFVIKHLLEDEISNIEDYCMTNNMQGILARIKGLRAKGKTLVVHQSSSANIVGNNKLFNCIVESVKKALKSNGLDYFGSRSQYQNVLSILKDPSSPFDFAKAFLKYRSRFTEYKTHQSVIQTLEDEEIDIEHRLELLDVVISVGDAERFVWTINSDDVINWIEDVVKGNSLHAIVFIWDEFTEFFKNNQNNITGLQELAQAAARIKFYLFLITHSNYQIINDNSAKRIIQDRFKISSMVLAGATAYKLLGQAVKPNPNFTEDWAIMKAELWRKASVAIRNTVVRAIPDIREEELKNLLPMHPYAIFLLKTLASDISSNQRTMFQFLSGDSDKGVEVGSNYRWFLDNFPNAQSEEMAYLTGDYLWDYFLQNATTELDSCFSSAIAMYNNVEPSCGKDKDKKKILKLTILLYALQQKSGATKTSYGQSGLLRPTLTNILANFAGTNLESQIRNVMQEFVSKGVLSAIQESNDTLYVPPAGSMDETRLNDIKEKIKREFTFEKLLDQGEVYDRFLLDGYLQYRFKILPITINNYKDKLQIASRSPKYEIPVFYFFVKNEVEQIKVNACIKKMYAEALSTIVVVNFSNTIFTDLLYDRLIQSKAEMDYFREKNQESQRALAQDNVRKIIQEWKDKLSVSSLEISLREGEVSRCSGGSNLKRQLKSFNSLLFPCGLEQIVEHDKIFSPSGYSFNVAQIGMGKFTPPNSQNYLEMLIKKLSNEGIWQNKEYTKVQPEHVISKMKKAISEVINQGFADKNEIALSEIWSALQKPPFGLFPCLGSTFLLGFLLKEYADSTYYKTDKVNTVILNNTDLSDLIFNIVRGINNHKPQYIVRQTDEHISFCNTAAQIFKIQKDKAQSIDDVSKHINVFLRGADYPFWCIEWIIKGGLTESPIFGDMLKSVELFCEFIANSNTARDKTKVAEDLHRLFKNVPMLDKKLIEIVTPENLKKGMSYYINQYCPNLVVLTERLGVDDNAYLTNLNRKLAEDSSYLWDKGDIDAGIDSLFQEYTVINSVNAILYDKRKDIAGIKTALENKLSSIKFPSKVLKTENEKVWEYLQLLVKICKEDIVHIDKIALVQKIDAGSSMINEFFANQLQLFKKTICQFIKEKLAQDEIENLFQKIELTAFDKSVDEYAEFLNKEFVRYRKSKKINQLKELWKERTGTNNVIALSEKLCFPLLIAFQDGVLAEKTFSVINGIRFPQNDQEVDECVAFINNKKFDIIFDIENLDRLFLQFFLGEYSTLVKNIKHYKNALLAQFGKNIYEWFYYSQKLKDFSIQYTKAEYAKISKDVKDTIKQQSSETIKKLVLDLVEKNPLFGATIMRHYGGQK